MGTPTEDRGNSAGGGGREDELQDQIDKLARLLSDAEAAFGICGTGLKLHAELCAELTRIQAKAQEYLQTTEQEVSDLEIGIARFKDLQNQRMTEMIQGNTSDCGHLIHFLQTLRNLEQIIKDFGGEHQKICHSLDTKSGQRTASGVHTDCASCVQSQKSFTPQSRTQTASHNAADFSLPHPGPTEKAAMAELVWNSISNPRIIDDQKLDKMISSSDDSVIPAILRERFSKICIDRGWTTGELVMLSSRLRALVCTVPFASRFATRFPNKTRPQSKNCATKQCLLIDFSWVSCDRFRSLGTIFFCP
jgi:hypothetical protein